jgi:pimeloyl-ACP methyl ester carboxylesterase
MNADHIFKNPGGEFHYLDWGGSGPKAHLAHATGFCAGTYSPLAKRLTPHLKLAGMDHRGHGKTRAEADPRNLKNWDIFVEDLERFVEFIGGPVIAIGHSLGGVVSLLLAVKRPDLVRALILLDPIILPYSWKWGWYLSKKMGLSKRVPIAARAVRRKRDWPDHETVLKAYRSKGSFKHWQDGFLEAYIAHGLESNGNGSLRLCCDPAWESRCFSVCPHDVWRYIPQLQCPTLVLYGRESDSFLKPTARRFKLQYPRAVLKGFPQTSHFVPMERPEETTKAVLEFLKESQISV